MNALKYIFTPRIVLLCETLQKEIIKTFMDWLNYTMLINTWYVMEPL